MKFKIVFIIGLLSVSCKEISFKESVQNIMHTHTRVMDKVKLSSGTLLRIDSLSSKYVKPRPVDIWLPNNYSENKKYAVLYMHDGQNLFDATTTWNKQEWKVDEWASKLMESREVKDFIVVGIHNIPEIRWQDLFPQKAFNYLSELEKEMMLEEAKKKNVALKLNGDNYLKFLSEELKPIIESEFSVFTNQANTLVCGSSMGGLMSMYALCEYPNIFGGAACLSTHWEGADPKENNPLAIAILDYMEANLPNPEFHKIYFDYGTETLDAFYPQYAPQVDKILKEVGYTKNNSANLKYEGTDHSENSWSKRLDIPLIFLLKD
jgi:enterochelin esterase-like enzyme